MINGIEDWQMPIHYNQSEQKTLRAKLRSEISDYEKIIWSKLRRSQLGVKFRRQYGIGPYVVDFYCPSIKLAIEIDGESHGEDNNPQYDKCRQEYIESFGVHFLRFSNMDVRDNLEDILFVILRDIEQHMISGEG
jgi:very-short-patch-repair endonuclease